MTSQSIILNLNKEFASSQAENYLQPVSQAYDVGKDAEVALYGANITRKPILNETEPGNKDNFTEVKLFMNEYPNISQQNDAFAGTLCDHNEIMLNGSGSPSPKAFPEVGSYTKDELCNYLAADFNINITEEVNGVNMVNLNGTPVTIKGKNVRLQVPYSVNYEQDDFYFGLQGTDFRFFTDALFPIQLNVGFPLNCQLAEFDNNETVKTADILTTINTASEINPVLSVLSNASISQTNYASFSRVCSSPLFPLFTQNSISQLDTYTQGCNQSFFEYTVEIDVDNNGTYNVVTGFTNTYLQSQWAASGTPELNTIAPPHFGVAQYPRVFVGLRHYQVRASDAVQDSYIEVFCPNGLTERVNYLDDTENLNAVFAEDMVRLANINIGNEQNGLQVGYRFIKHKNQAGVAFHQAQVEFATESQGRTFFGDVYSFQIYTKDLEGEDIIYDSCGASLYFPANLIEDGFLINAVNSDRGGGQRCNIGFMPYMFVNSAAPTEGISSPKGNWICYKEDSDDVYTFRQGAEDYRIVVSSPSLQQALGQADKDEKNITLNRKATVAGKKFAFTKNNEINYDPNAYPRFKNQAGLTKLYSDNTQYNIELNLPVKAYNTTRTNKNNIGQKRTIIYKTEPVIEGESHNIDSVFINKNIQPNSLKFLTLNNSEPLNLNNLNVQIRRNHNNELATELEDASVEVLIKSK